MKGVGRFYHPAVGIYFNTTKAQKTPRTQHGRYLPMWGHGTPYVVGMAKFENVGYQHHVGLKGGKGGPFVEVLIKE